MSRKRLKRHLLEDTGCLDLQEVRSVAGLWDTVGKLLRREVGGAEEQLTAGLRPGSITSFQKERLSARKSQTDGKHNQTWGNAGRKARRAGERDKRERMC